MTGAPTLQSVSITAGNLTIAKGLTTQFTATGTFSDGSTQDVTGSVTWTSLNTGVVTITAGGLAKGVAVGSATIEAASGTVNKSVTLQVTAPTLVSISVMAANGSIAKGMTDQFTATGTLTDGTTQNLTPSATWSSLNTGIATIGAGGLATGVGIGSATIQAASGGMNGTATLNVTAATLVSIAVTPANQTIVKGLTQQFTATGTFTDNSTQNLTTSATWSSLNTGFATITAGGLTTGVGIGTTTIQAKQGSIIGTTSLTVNAATLVSIALSPTNPTVASGLTKQFTATGTFTDSSTQDLTTSVTWSSGNTAIATISNTAGTIGLATAINTGTTAIQAQQGAVSGSTMLTVSTVSLAVLVLSPQNPVIADGGAAQTFTATGHFSDGSTQDLTASAVWTSSNTNVATMNGSVATSQALAGGATAGFTSIQAVVGTTNGVAILSVTKQGGNGFAGVFTHHNDIARTGLNANEIVLTPTLVSGSHTFGKKFSAPVDAAIYAQPLYVPNVSIAGGTHNVVYVVTEGDSAYAFDADTGTQYWHANMIDPAHGGTGGETTVSGTTDVNCGDLIPIIGITSTPVIDPSTGTMYLETKSKKTSGTFVHRLHGIDITTGFEKLGTPPDVAGTALGGSITFDALNHMNRPGLLWLNGMIYVAYASHCDSTPFYGWVFAYDAATLTQKAVWNAAPIAGTNGGLGGIWMAGAGLAADSAANIFISTGNGLFDTTNVPATLLGDTEVKLFYNGTTTYSLLDYFTPFNQLNLESGDVDLGSGGILLLPDQPGSHPHELVQVGKEGTIRLIDRDQMTTGNLHYCASNCNNQDAQIAQELVSAVSGVWGMPAYWNGNVYICGKADNLASYALNSSGMLSTTRAHNSVHRFGYPGATPSVSANGTTNAIVWAIDTTNNGTVSGGNNTPLLPAVLYAYDATNLTDLYNSSVVAGDAAGDAVKFAVPTIANGKVYIGTATELDAYGPLP
jgi:Big-like domain-containing protein